MKKMLKLVVVSAIALLVSVPAVLAQTPESSTLPVTEPLDAGGTILQPGTYVIRVLPSNTDRNKVQITNVDGSEVFATLLTVPHPLEPNEEYPNTTFLFYPAAEGSPRALRTWFAPGTPTLIGHDIVYDESRAKQLARLANSRVVFQRDETLQVVTPAAEIETYTYVAPTTPVATQTTIVTETPAPMVSSEVEMPATASRIPLFALIGLVSVAGAIALRMARQ